MSVKILEIVSFGFQLFLPGTSIFLSLDRQETDKYKNLQLLKTNVLKYFGVSSELTPWNSLVYLRESL